MEEEVDRAFDPDSREHSQGSQNSHDTLQLEPEIQLQHIQHLDLSIDEQTTKQLCELSKHNTKEAVISFIIKRIQQSNRKTSTNLDILSSVASQTFWSKTISHMITNLLTNKQQQVPLMFCRVSRNEVVSLTRREVYLLLCGMFFVTIPPQIHCDLTSFQFLYSSDKSKRSKANSQKLKCLMCYFDTLTLMSTKELEQEVVFERTKEDKKGYLKYSRPLSTVTITNNEIQTYKGQILVDFANSVLGGGVLYDGCVQEEIMFVLHPEMMVSRLLCSQLADDEAVAMHGIRQYSEYEGYSDTFTFKSPCKNEDVSTFVAVDAFDFRGYDPEIQYSPTYISREMHKAYIGFHHQDKDSKRRIGDRPKHKKRIVTGKWGCGVFGGDPELKFLVQWMACSCTSREMVFVNWNESKETNQTFEEVIRRLSRRRTTDLRKILERYSQFRSEKVAKKESKDISLFHFVLQQ